MPCMAKIVKSKEKTPYGANCMRVVTNFKITLFNLSKLCLNGSAKSPAPFKAIPNSRAKTIIWSIFPSAIAATGLVGKILTITSLKLGAVWGENSWGRAILRFVPGSINKAQNRASEIATAVVNKYKEIVLKEILLSWEVEAIEQTPQINETKTNGTTANLKEAINILPISIS